MAIVYTKAELLAEVDKGLTPETVSNFYKQGFLNYTGITTDTKEKYTEIIAKRLLSDMTALEGVLKIT